MARAIKATKPTKPAALASARKPDRPSTTPAKPGKPTAAAPKRASAAAAAAPKPSKDELRFQVEKLESTVATLRTKNRDANRAAKIAAARIAELEDQVAQLEKNAASQARSAAPVKSATPSRVKRKNRDLDPGDAVPPGVAVQEPGPLDEEAEAARANLEAHLEGG